MKYERIEKTVVELNDEVINEILNEVGYTKEEVIEEYGSVEGDSSDFSTIFVNYFCSCWCITN